MHPPSPQQIGNDDSPRALWNNKMGDREIVVVISESSERRGEWKKRGDQEADSYVGGSGLIWVYRSGVPLGGEKGWTICKAKTISDAYEEKNGVKLPSYKGDNINGDEFTEKSRITDPQRIVRAYCQSAATLNLLRSFATG